MSEWVKQKEWKGNPALGLDSWMKEFKLPSGRKVPVYVFGCAEPIQQRDEEDGYKWVTHGWSYCVSAGANSEYSYSGGFENNKLSVEELLKQVDQMYEQDKLIR